MSILKTLTFIANHPLNRGHKAQSLLKFVRWQLGSRLTGGRTINNWINGTRLIAHAGETGATGNIYCGLHEFADMAYVLHVVDHNDLFIDVGANIGAYTVLACGAKGARGFCFEPIPSTFQRLSDNLRLNNLSGRVTALNIGLSDQDTELTFSAGSNCMNHVVDRPQSGEDCVRVAVQTLDSVLSSESPTIMKIDVEGFEFPVVKGGHKTLDNPSLNSVIMELNGSGSRYGYDEQSILKRMRNHGFAPYSYEPFSRQLRAIESRDTTTGNLIFIRDVARVVARIANSPRTSIGSTEL